MRRVSDPIPWLLGAVVLAAVLTYAPTTRGEFVHDDHHSIADNPSLRDLGNVGRFFTDSRSFASGGSSHTRPVLLTTFALNFALGHTATGFKVTSLALHCLNILLLFLLVRRALRRWNLERDADLVALVAAAVFALHPLNTQAVVYASSRSALLTFTFYAAALLAFVRWRSLVADRGGLQPGALALYLACQALALLTKEHAVSIVGAVLLLEVGLFQAARERIDWRRLAGSVAAAGLPIVVYLIYRSAMIKSGSAVPTNVSIMHSTAVEGSYLWQLATQLEAQLVYLKLFAWPAGHALQHTIVPVASFADPGFLAGLALVGVALGWGLRSWWRGSPLATGVLLFLCAMGPEALVRLNMAVNEHRFYLPALGLLPVVAWLALRAQRRLQRLSPMAGRGAIVAGVALLGVLAWQARTYAETWRTECSVWARSVAVSPDDSWSQNNHGNCNLLANNLAVAEAAYLRALELAPDNTLAIYNLSIVAEKQGRWAEAAAFVRRYHEATAGRNQAMYANRLINLEILAGERK